MRNATMVDSALRRADGKVSIKLSRRQTAVCVLVGVLFGWIAGQYGYLLANLEYTLFPPDKVLSKPYFSTLKGNHSEEIAEVVAGQTVYANWHYERYRECPVVFESNWHNGQTVVRGGTHTGTHKKPGEYENTIATEIPEILYPGHWEFRVSAEWTCNPFRSHIKYYPAIPLEVKG